MSETPCNMTCHENISGDCPTKCRWKTTQETIKALEAERITLLQESTYLQARIWELEAEVKRLTPRPPAAIQEACPPEDELDP